MASSSDSFERVVGSLDYPMFVVTAAAGEDRDGCLVGFLTQTSIDPPRVLVCLSRANRTTEIAGRADALVVHVLRHTDLDLAAHFGEQRGDEVDKLAGLDWSPGPDGAPVLSGIDWFGGPVVGRHDDLGDHLGFLVEPVHADALPRRADAPQLGYQATRSLRPGNPA